MLKNADQVDLILEIWFSESSLALRTRLSCVTLVV